MLVPFPLPHHQHGVLWARGGSISSEEHREREMKTLILAAILTIASVPCYVQAGQIQAKVTPGERSRHRQEEQIVLQLPQHRQGVRWRT